MSGDRSGYRHIYPKILSFTEEDAQRLLDEELPPQVDPKEYQEHMNMYEYMSKFAEDARRIRNGVTMVAWPDSDNKMVDFIRNNTVEICMFRLAQVSKIAETRERLTDALGILGIKKEDWEEQIAQFTQVITDEELSRFKEINPKWEEVFLTVPVYRLQSAVNWKKPFDAVDAALSQSNFPMLDYYFDKMNSRITRGHNWFGVGEWNIANRHYLTALSIAISTNNCVTIEAIVRFLVDTYVAAGDLQSSVNITDDFLDSLAYQQSPGKWMTAEMLEAVAVAFALVEQLDKSQEWIKKIPIFCERTPHDQVSEWNIIQLLTDVYRFREDSHALSVINSAAREVSKLL